MDGSLGLLGSRDDSVLGSREKSGFFRHHSGLHGVVSSFGDTGQGLSSEEIVQLGRHGSQCLDDVVNDGVGDLLLDSSGKELSGELVEDVVLGVSNGDGQSVDVALNLEKSNDHRLVRGRLQLPDDSEGNSSSLREIDVSNSMVFDFGHSLSSVEESDVLEVSSDSIDFHHDLDRGLVGGESLDGHSSIRLGSEVDELGKQVTDVKKESFDREVVLGVGSLDLGDGQVGKSRGHDGDENHSHLAKRLLDDEKIGLSRSVEGKVSSELLHLGREVLSDRVVLDVDQDELHLVEDVLEERSVLSLEEVSSLIEESSSVLSSGGVVEGGGLSNSLEDERSEVGHPHSGLGVFLHSVEENPVSSFELVHGSSSRELFEDELEVLPDSVVFSGGKGIGSSGLILDGLSLGRHVVNNLEDVVDSSVVFGSASELVQESNESIPEGILLLLRNDGGVSKSRGNAGGLHVVGGLLSDLLLSRLDERLEDVEDFEKEISELSRSNSEHSNGSSVVEDRSSMSSHKSSITSSDGSSDSGSLQVSSGVSSSRSSVHGESLKLLVSVLLSDQSRSRSKQILNILNENLSLGGERSLVLGFFQSDLSSVDSRLELVISGDLALSKLSSSLHQRIGGSSSIRSRDFNVGSVLVDFHYKYRIKTSL